jgi:hypothetical protein
LVDGAGEPLCDLAFLSDGDLLTQTLIAALRLFAGEFELFAGAIIAELRLLAGVLQLLSADADLPQGHPGANPGADEDEQARQALEQGGAGIVLEPIAAFAARSLVSRGQPGQVGVRQGWVPAVGEHPDAQQQRGGQHREDRDAGERPAKGLRQ